jgi:hypothetical protein
VERCAFERANLIIGASDMVAVTQRKSYRIQKPTKQREQGERTGIRKCTTTPAESSPIARESAGGRSCGVDPGLRTQVAGAGPWIARYGTDFNSPGRQKACASVRRQKAGGVGHFCATPDWINWIRDAEAERRDLGKPMLHDPRTALSTSQCRRVLSSSSGLHHFDKSSRHYWNPGRILQNRRCFLLAAY